MADVTISYKNAEIATMNATGVKTLLTGDTFCEDDIVVAYTKPATPAPTLQSKTVYPSASDQTTTPDQGYDGLSSVTSKGVLLTNLTADNIKKDVVVKVGDSADDDRITSITGTYEGSGGGGGPSWPDPSTVTDLTGTTWYMNDTIDHTSLPQNPSKYNVLFFTHQQWASAQAKPYGLAGTLGNNYVYYWPYAQVYIGLYRSSYSAQLPSGDLGIVEMFGSSAGRWAYYQNNAAIGYLPSTSSWHNTMLGGRLWTFIPAGAQDSASLTTDHTNATLIAWMKANGTLILKA